MLIFWLVVGIELTFGQDIIKGDDLSRVLDSTFDKISEISYLDFSDLAMIQKSSSILTKTITQQQTNVKLAVSKLSNNYFQKEISDIDKDKILGFYDVVQQRMSILSSLSARTYDFYSKQKAENDDFISNTEEMMMILNDIQTHNSVEELSDIIDIIVTFKNSVNQARDQLFFLIDDYNKFTKETESYMNEQRIQMPKDFLDGYKIDKNGVSNTQNVMLWAMIIATVATTSTPMWPLFLAAEWGLSLEYNHFKSGLNSERFERSKTYDNIDNNIQNSFFALDQCVTIMRNASKILTDIDNGLGTLLSRIKQIRRTSHELKCEFTDKEARSLLRKLRVLKSSFERRQKSFFPQKKHKLAMQN